MSEASSNSPQKPPLRAVRAVDEAVRLYGDLVYDLCESVMWNQANAQVAFRAILKKVRSRHETEPYRTHEREWVLRIACVELLAFALKHGRKLSPSEQIQLDSDSDEAKRLKRFEAFFHRLHAEDQILLLLKDKYGIPFPEISSATGQPESSLKLRRSQALRTLEEWIWETR